MCKWFERWNCLTSPSSHEQLEKKSKQSSISESDCNGSRFCTPPEIYRKTSTPMLLGQKTGFETFSVPDFSFKTPKTDSSSIAQVASISKTQTSDTQFFSCLLYSSNEETTPFRICKEEQFAKSNSGSRLSVMEQFARSNSGNRLSIMEVEQEKITNNDTKIITANVNEVLSPVNMDLTRTEGGILQDSPMSDDVCEDIMKKVRFSDQYETAVEFGDLMESCVRTILNMSMEENESHDAQKRAAAAEDIKDANKRMQMNSIENTNTLKVTNDNQAEDTTRSLIQPPENFLNNSQIGIVQDNTKNIKKENQNADVNNEVNNGWSIINQDSNRVLMMVLMESNSGGLTTELMPLISSGLQKLQEQLVSNRQSLNTAESTKICRRSITTMKMSVESVESVENYSADNAGKGQFALSSPVESSENSNNGGFLSSVTQAVKHALKNLSGQLNFQNHLQINYLSN